MSDMNERIAKLAAAAKSASDANRAKSARLAADAERESALEVERQQEFQTRILLTVMKVCEELDSELRSSGILIQAEHRDSQKVHIAIRAETKAGLKGADLTIHRSFDLIVASVVRKKPLPPSVVWDRSMSRLSESDVKGFIVEQLEKLYES